METMKFRVEQDLRVVVPVAYQQCLRQSIKPWPSLFPCRLGSSSIHLNCNYDHSDSKPPVEDPSLKIDAIGVRFHLPDSDVWSLLRLLLEVAWFHLMKK
jgi:hypothetical protein